MPAVVSHYLLAERVFNDLLKSDIETNLNHTAFLWGAYGPDIFFSHRIMPWQRQKSLSYLSGKLHNTDADKILNYIMSYAKNFKSSAAKSYAFGFATHYATDSTIHPFILYFSDLMSKGNPTMHPSVCHNDIESKLDTLFLKYEKNQKITSFRLQDTSPVDKDIFLLIADILHRLFMSYDFGNIPEKDIVRVQYDWHNSLVLLNDRLQIKKPIVRLGERLLNLPQMLSPIIRTPYPDLSFDYANMKKSEWYKHGTEKHNESFFDLVDTAESISIELIKTMNSGKLLTHSQCSDTFTGAEPAHPITLRDPLTGESLTT